MWAVHTSAACTTETNHHCRTIAASPFFVYLLYLWLLQDSEVISGEDVVLERYNPELQASLDSEAVVDPMDAEQTWPTEDELRMAEGYCMVLFHSS